MIEPQKADVAAKPATKLKKITGIPGLVDGVSLESMTEIFNAENGKVLQFKGEASGKRSTEPLNTITGEPYIGCGLAGDSLKRRNIPALYYNAKVKKPTLFVGESGTGKTSIAECFGRNFGNADVNDIMKFKDDWSKENIATIVDQKREPVLRVQNYNGILKEEIVGEWAAIKMLFAEKGEEIFDPVKFFRMGALTRGLENPGRYHAVRKDSKYGGRVVLLDEITRGSEDTMNVYLEPLRERTVTTEGECFGECQKGFAERPRFYVVATANEGDVGTIDMASAMQTRFSREVVEFIEASEEEKIVRDVLVKVGASKEVMDYAMDDQTGVRCLVRHFRQEKPLRVKPNVGDTRNLAETFFNLNVTKDRMKDPANGSKLRGEVGHVLLSMLGKNSDDAAKVIADFKPPNGTCGITMART
jgi:MoxR-like ATPase